MSQLVKRKIDVTIKIAGKDGEKGREISIKGLRTSVSILTYNGDAQGQLHLQIWGLPLSTINELTTIGPIMTQRRNNRVTVSAGDENGPMATVYDGVIFSAFGDFQALPEVALNIVALSAAYEAVQESEPKSYPGPVAAADVMETLAKEMGLSFENNGVDVMLPAGTYFSGSPLTQVKECAFKSQIYYTIDRGKLAIWPRKGARKGDAVLISPRTGLVGYPAFSSAGLVLTSIFNPDIMLGGKIKVESELTPAAGEWNVYKVAHALDSEMPRGRWFTQMLCYRPEWVEQ